MKRKQLLLLFACLVLLAACAAPDRAVPPPAAAVSPGAGDWPVSDPAAQGMDPRLLDKMQAEIAAERMPLDSLLIIRHGQIVSETYYGSQKPESRHEQFSVTKSFTATLIGIAVDQGKLESVDAKGMDFFPGKAFAEPDPRKQDMTVKDLLTMTSGLGWVEGDPSYAALYRSSDWSKWVLDLPVVEDPGEAFNYCSGCSHVLSAILQEATGENPRDFADRYLMKPLGITNYGWETDADGTPIGGWGLSLTPRDMARLGALYLNGGKWGDTQIISEEWVEAATTAHVPTGGRLGYGYQWWIYDTHGAYTALGRGGQTVFVSPELDLIVVTTARMNTGHDPIFSLIDSYILPAVSD